jgi:hypothetical protein
VADLLDWVVEALDQFSGPLIFHEVFKGAVQPFVVFPSRYRLWEAKASAVVFAG